jgi:CubicO group peptidase (beta-lactamase class C family)
VYVNAMADYLPYYATDSLAFEPGTKMLYSNAGMALLGLVIEKVSGQSFYAYVQQHVLDPAGMTGAAYVDVRTHPRDVAVGYGRPDENGPEVENWDFIEQRSGPAGGAYASAPDLVAFSQALFGGRIVKPALVREFTSGKIAMGPQMQYAFGFGTGDIAGWRMVGHNGGAPGINAEFMAFPDQGLDVVVLVNMEPPAATRAISKIVEVLTGRTLMMAR